MTEEQEQQRMPWAPQPKPIYSQPFLPDNHRQRAAIQNGLLDKGLHPLMGNPVNKEGKRCGDCGYLHSLQLFHKKAIKCSLREGASPTTDVRKLWPACALFKEATQP